MMYTDILLSIAGIGVFPTISLVLFVTVFTVMLVRVARADPRQLEARAALPLDTPAAGGTERGR
jgi:UPF0716 family protein affecting phage T7 exclusion